MGSGKHASFEERASEFSISKIIILIIIILLLIIGIIFGTVKMASKLGETDTTENEVTLEVADADDFKTLGKLVIDKISVEESILDSTDDEALEAGVIKLYGDKLNKEGNFCIAGHNYEDVFKHLDELEIGDEIKVIDKHDKETKYKITEIETVDPTDLEMLKSTEGKTEITIITCENYSTQRLIVKAEKEVE